MTHILIPISLLKERIELAQKEDEAAILAGFSLAAQGAKCRASVYTLILGDKNLKQMSLDEEDIVVNKKIRDVWVSQVSMTFDQHIPKERLQVFEESLGRIFDCAYKQALKDLL